MKYILMDLDGTITDPKEGITKSIQYALKFWNIEVDDLDTLCKFIGPPLRDSFMDFYGFSVTEAEEAVKKYREYFEVTGLYENIVYNGMENLLSSVKALGKKLIVATSKPELMAKKILQHFELAQYFDDICGATMDGSRSSKEEVIRYALEKNNIVELAATIMVGDRKYDIEGAKQVGLSSIGVLYGYGDRDELAFAGADKIVSTVKELQELLTGE
ncbi:MAG: hypothetical protein K0S47_643 [Herbinix sp.]|jgi:phosphoglycolate phosphatase|nr:hypothetical protein [Herbinix sp.]